ncbi:MAG TPA: cation:dicarboxylase symporter family transporter [Thermoanaerobaculia bacterium]|nr:cation:dicarboxylase symporter family transporter [Thermoanaerobaculia bacterium]
MFPATLVEGTAFARRGRRPSFTTWSLIALAAGLVIGLLGHRTESRAVRALAAAAKPIGDVWFASLQMVIVPLMVVFTLAAIVSSRREGVGSLTGRAVLLFTTMLAAGAVLALLLMPRIVRLYPVDPATIAALEARTSVPAAVREIARAGPVSVGEWVSALIPRNLLESAVRGEILPLLLFTVLIGLAITRLPSELRDPLSRILEGCSEAMLIAVRWILALTPVGVFAFALLFALGAGGAAIGVLGAWAVIGSGLSLLCTLLLYPVTALLGRTRVRDFARAVAPAQLVAATTRSSIAALPALVQGGRERLRLPDTATGLVLPLGVSLFKLNRIVSSTAKVIFLAHVCGVSLSAGQVTTFLLTIGILSFSTAGIPSRGTLRSLPAYLAAGIPLEAVVLVDTVEAIPDVFGTVLNVTGDMSAATLLSRSSRVRRAADAALPVETAAARTVAEME